jgi:hypothetical protein
VTPGSGFAVAAGIVLLGVTAWDVVTTVFGPSMGSGPLTRGSERLLVPFAGRLRTHHRALVWIGPLFAAATTPAWLGLMWLGWALVFQPAGELESRQGTPEHRRELADHVIAELVRLVLRGSVRALASPAGRGHPGW